MPQIELYNEDCMELMKRYPDNHFELAIVDPPYGIDVSNMPFIRETRTRALQKNGTKLNAHKNKVVHKSKDWDKQTPSQEYFDELKRVSVNQIVFGIDYMKWDNVGSGRIKWNKGVPEGMSFNRYEIAYCSLFDDEIEIELLWSGMFQAKSITEPMVQQGNKKLNEKRTHPCQKPILLYKKLLMDYAKQGDKILDTHGGSMSITLACHDLGFDLVLSELDKEYFEDGKKRLENHQAQLSIFDQPTQQKPTQLDLL